MKDEKKERYPSYVPLHHRVFTKIRKVSRQSAVRKAEATARRTPPKDLYVDGAPVWSDKKAAPGAINKSALPDIDQDLSRPEFVGLAASFASLKERLKEKGFRYTNTAATFLPRMFYPRSERTKLWENVWTIYHSGVRKGHRVLDIGGASTPFSFYLASMGCSTHVIDNDWGNCGTIYNANYVARKMGWDMKTVDRDVSQPLPFPDGHFDRVFSICTIEHLPSTVRRFMMKEIGRVLKPEGIAAVTFCYDPKLPVVTVDRGLRFGYREKFAADVIWPSGLEIYGNQDLLDAGEDEFLGAIFLKKRGHA